MYKRKKLDITESSFINANGELINIYSSFENLKQEFHELGISTNNATVDKLMSDLSKLTREEYKLTGVGYERPLASRLNLSYKYKKICVLKNHLLLLSFYLYNYKSNLMPSETKRIFEDQTTLLELV